MKKRLLSMFMALALCLTLLPTAALAEELGPVDGTSTVETAGADAEAEAKAKAGAEAVAAVQAMIGELPSLGELKGMDSDTLNEVYMAVQSAYDAYEALSEEQQAQVTGADRFEELFGWFNSQVAPLEDSGNIYPDVVESDGSIRAGISGDFSRNGLIVEGSNDSTTFYGNQYYVVKESSNVTINGDLIIDSCINNGLILCKGATLTVTGALIHNGGSSFGIYGTSNNGADAGELVINNSLDNGAAIRTGSTSTPQLNIYSGEVTINAGKSGKLVEGVELYSTNKIHAATLDAKKVLPAEWRGVSSIKGTSLVLEYCGHAEDDPEYVDYVEVDETQHRWQCKACGFEGGVEACFTNTTISGITPNDNGTHTLKCICGREKNENCSYVSLSTPEATPDGKGHTASMCSVCGSPEDKAEAHTYDADGKCTACTFEPLAKDEAGDLYGRTQDHSDVSLDVNDALAKGHTITLWRPDTIASKTIQGIYIDFDAAGKSATLDMNGYSLETSKSAPITVENGTLTVTGDATLVQNGTRELASSAVRVTGGTLIFEGNLTATGASGKPAVEVTGGTLRLKAGDVLNGGVSVEGSENYETVNALLGENLAFAKVGETSTIVNGNVKSIIGNVTVVAHTHSIEEGQSACACGKQFEASVTAEGGVSYYDTIDSAFAAAHEGDTVTLLADITNRGGRGIFVSGGPYTLDLNGHRIEAGIDLMVGDMDGSGVLLRGELTVKDSSTNNAGYVQSLKLWNGDLTVESGSFRWIVESGSGSVGTITITGGTADEVKHTSAGVTFRLSGGTFKYVENIVSGKPGDLLADNRAFFNRDNNFVNGYDDRYQAVSDVVVKEHTHHIVDGSCECGFTCAHDWSKKNGVCTVCGSACPHNAGAAEAGGVWACNTCGQTVTAKVVAPDGAITYYADGYVDNNVKSGLYFAIKAAKTGSTVAALGGEYSGGYVTGGKTLTLDVSNGKPISGTLNVGEKDSVNKLIVRGSAEISYVIVAPGNTLDLTGWTGRIGFLNVQKGGTAKLNGGTFAKLHFNGAEAGSLLASGYAFQNADNGAYVEYSSTADMENVTVVKCPHSGVTLKEDNTGAECKYCGASFAATLDDAPYGKIDAAVTDWLKNGGTLKLYADYTAADGTWSVGSGSHTVDLNGHMMSVQGDGSAFFKPTHNMHLTVTDGTERGQIENILLDGSQGGSFTLESGGYVCNLKMTDGAVVTLKGGSVDTLDVQNCSANTNLSIQGGSIGKLNITDWAEGMHVSATGGSLGAYTLPSGKILADVMDHQYYAEGTSLDRQVDTAQPTEKFVIKQAPYDFGSTSKAANVPINGSIPFRVDSPSGDATGYYDVRWYRRTNSGAEHMTVNRVADVNVNDKLDVFCVITGADRPGGAMKWQVAVKGYTIKVVPARLDGATVTLDHDSFVFDGNSHTPTVTRVTLENKALTNDDYTVSVDKGTNAGTYELIVTGKGNYTGKVEIPWTITKRIISVKDVTLGDKTYDGKVEDDPNKVTGVNFENLPDSVTFTKNTDYTIASVTYDSPNANVENLATVRVKLEGLAAVNYAFNADGQSYVEFRKENVAIQKADADTVEPIEFSIANGIAKTYTIPLPALPKPTAPCEYGQITYGSTPTVTMDVAGYYTDGAKVENGKLLLPIEAKDTEDTGKIGTVTITVSTTNYDDFPLTINVKATNKIVPTGEPTLSAKTLTYGQALSAIKLSGTMKDGDKTVSGAFAWMDGTVTPEVGSGTYEAAWKFTPTDGDTYAEADGTVTITVNKAKPTSDPIYTRITAENKTLKDAALKPNTSWPTGTIQWVDKDGKELPDTTEVKANTAYKWIFTPTGADADNYTTATGELTLYSVSTGGGSSSGSTVKTDTVTNPDGSVTKTETKKDGTVIETTTGKDGSVSQTTTNPNGSSVTETKAADGSTGTVKTDKHGQTEASAKVSAKAVENAKKNGEPVTAPVEVEATRDSSTAPTVKIELPRNSGDTKVEIPVTNVKPGTVAVLVHADGTEEILKDSIPTEDGIRLTVDGSATVKIVDNAKDFIDTQNHWAKDEIDFVSARELVDGISATRYAPDASATRAQLWTILARQNDANLSGGNTWYEKAQLWSKDKGISDGTNPNGTINRAQMVTMLWRAAGSPAAQSGTAFQDVAAGSYYGDAVAWAVENGITAGVGGGRFDPNSTCTRAQIATFLYRTYQGK